MTSLPRAAYTSADWQKREREELFASAWQFAGTVQDFEATGDFRTVQAGAFPLAIVKSKDGSLQAHHNVCRHRGATLLEDEMGNTGSSLVCPYHRWTYGLDGRLRGAPDLASCFPDLDRTGLGLKPASVGVYKDLVFVNPNPDADFSAWIRPIEPSAWPHEISSKELREAAPLIYDMKCDWKVFVENAIDGYHLAYLHEHTLGGPIPSENVWERRGDHLVWYATDDGAAKHRIPGLIREQTKSLPRLKHIAGTEYGGVYLLFPSTLIVPTPFGFSVSSMQATAPGRCRMTVRHWVGPWQSKDPRKGISGYDKSSGVISSDHWKKHPLETGDFQTEDVWICERVQLGLESPAYEAGPLAQGAGAEDPVAWFRRSLLQRMPA
ncbi:MAG: aromatic ring-hydroxylating dioxygenase subunit alpha [Pseudomonadota bacterium]